MTPNTYNFRLAAATTAGAGAILLCECLYRFGFVWNADNGGYIFKLNKSKRAYNRLFDVYLIV
ncbi:MAG: hypothetical protein DRP15_04055 [Candidatus Aenigmatarchaeota archaeon]|nr:MAG: hypothetical protein DRP15_04055 [Candidatus Aenigmarchaeota archaeon]